MMPKLAIPLMMIDLSDPSVDNGIADDDGIETENESPN